MGNVSKPLVVLLVGTVAFFALWIVALKPSGTGSSQSQGLGAYQSAINKAHQAVALSSAASAAHDGAAGSNAATATQPAASSASPTVTTTTSAQHTTSSSSSSQNAAAAAQHRQDVVSQALHANKVLALLFYNPAAADDRAVEQELSSIPSERGKVVKLEVPLSELSQYSVVTSQVPVSESPTLVVIDPDQQATTITGFADSFEISQRIDEALSVR